MLRKTATKQMPSLDFDEFFFDTDIGRENPLQNMTRTYRVREVIEMWKAKMFAD